MNGLEVDYSTAKPLVAKTMSEVDYSTAKVLLPTSLILDCSTSDAQHLCQYPVVYSNRMIGWLICWQHQHLCAHDFRHQRRESVDHEVDRKAWPSPRLHCEGFTGNDAMWNRLYSVESVDAPYRSSVDWRLSLMSLLIVTCFWRKGSWRDFIIESTDLEDPLDTLYA